MELVFRSPESFLLSRWNRTAARSVRSVGAYFTGSFRSLYRRVSLIGFFPAPVMYRLFQTAVNGLGFIGSRPQNFSWSLMSVLLPWPRQSNRNTLNPSLASRLASPSQSPLSMLLSLPGGYIRITTGAVPGSLVDLWNRPRSCTPSAVTNVSSMGASTLSWPKATARGGVVEM